MVARALLLRPGPAPSNDSRIRACDNSNSALARTAALATRRNTLIGVRRRHSTGVAEVVLDHLRVDADGRGDAGRAVVFRGGLIDHDHVQPAIEVPAEDFLEVLA
jgi:hypothetical protein